MELIAVQRFFQKRLFFDYGVVVSTLPCGWAFAAAFEHHGVIAEEFTRLFEEEWRGLDGKHRIAEEDLVAIFPDEAEEHLGNSMVFGAQVREFIELVGQCVLFLDIDIDLAAEEFRRLGGGDDFV